MKLVVLGARGSTTAPGPDFLRYGGHTSSIAVLADADQVPRLVLDAGTGLRQLPELLRGNAFCGSIVLSHLHWDHLHGLPFSPAVDHEGARVRLWLPEQTAPEPPAVPVDQRAQGGLAERMLAQVMSPPFFPIGPDGLLGSWDFQLARPGQLDLGVPDPGAPGGAQPEVTVAPVRHKGGTTLAIRIDLDGQSAAYVPDHALSTLDGERLVDLSGEDDAAARMVHGVDLLLHDGQFTTGEARTAAMFGHSTVQDALHWADQCQAGRVVITHHAPGRTDAELDDLSARYARTPQGRPVAFARQGDVLSPALQLA